jgi:hypothetical protein
MSSVKCITGRDQREARPRKSKTDARESLVEVEEIDEDAFNETMINQAEQAAEQKKKKVNTVRVTNNAPNLTCVSNFVIDWMLVREKGSAKKTKQKIVKAELQTGVFEVLKRNMVKVTKAVKVWDRVFKIYEKQKENQK